MVKITSINDVKRFNEHKGFFFFGDSEMKFFNSIIETGLIDYRFFITSERYKKSKEYPKRYTIRYLENSGRIETIGKFQKFQTLKKAKEAIFELVGYTKVKIICDNCRHDNSRKVLPVKEEEIQKYVNKKDKRKTKEIINCFCESCNKTTEHKVLKKYPPTIKTEDKLDLSMLEYTIK